MCRPYLCSGQFDYGTPFFQLNVLRLRLFEMGVILLV